MGGSADRRRIGNSTPFFNEVEPYLVLSKPGSIRRMWTDSGKKLENELSKAMEGQKRRFSAIWRIIRNKETHNPITP
jgi:hypothetical protein